MVRFARSRAEVASGESWVDLSGSGQPEAPRDGELDLRGTARAGADAWRVAFIDWLGGLNRRNAGLRWWAYTGTAKNFLSSPLGDACFQALAVNDLNDKVRAGTLCVVGASDALAQALAGERNGSPGLRDRLDAIARIALQFLRVAALYATGRLRLRPLAVAPDVVLFTYADRGFRGKEDAFFGPLDKLLAARRPSLRACHVAFLHGPFRACERALAGAEGEYRALFAALRARDLLCALKDTLLAWWAAPRCTAPPLRGLQATPLLRAALLWDVGRGGYFLNLLVYHGVMRILKAWQPRWLIYPYENKALEKMLLLGARDSGVSCKVVGFQHTAITRRHTTLLFSEGEAEVTPLPARIVTPGESGLRHLSQAGRYPPGLLAAGCALRQRWRAVLPRRASVGSPEVRVLLALSSSRAELVEAVRFMSQAALQQGRGLEIGVRPHPEFPLSGLPEDLRHWISTRAIDFTGTALEQNIEWCDVVVYVSSTVALEALMAGRPVVNLRLGDAIDPDPVLEPVALSRKVATAQAFLDGVESIRSAPGDAFEAMQSDTVRAMQRYFHPVTPERIEVFLP